LSRHFVIFNPAAGRGRGLKRIKAYRSLLSQHIDRVTFAETTRAGEERSLADLAIAQGYEIIVAVGGDGTWGNVADRIVASNRDNVTLGILPNGTGNDFGRNLGYDPSSPQKAVVALAGGHVCRVDMGRVETLSSAEHTPHIMEQRNFLNLVGFGFDVAVIDAAANARFLKGELLYKITALQQLFRFPGTQVRMSGQNGENRGGPHLMLTISNGCFFGGGFPIAPEATVQDGYLHACRIQDAPAFTRLKLFNKAERGLHVTSDPDRVEILSDKSFKLDFLQPPRFEMDGDVRLAASSTVEVSVLPQVLRVITPEAT
jgi:YegS/Rv2252/BmrU family lipid kinase